MAFNNGIDQLRTGSDPISLTRSVRISSQQNQVLAKKSDNPDSGSDKADSGDSAAAEAEGKGKRLNEVA